MNTIKRRGSNFLAANALLAGVALYSATIYAQPPLSKLPQATPPVISEASVEIIRKQATTKGNVAVQTSEAELPPIAQTAMRMATADAAKSDNRANQETYIADVKRKLSGH